MAPGEPRHGVAEGVVFAADPARVAELVDAPEDEVPADFAGAGLVASWYVGELHGLSHRHQRLQAPGDVALGGLAVVDVELQPEPVMPDRRDDRDMATLPLDANVQFMTVMATKMPYIGRG
jgi:hypothetical protein